MARLAAWILPLCLASCQWPGVPAEGSAAAPPAEIGPGTTLNEALLLLEAQLDSVVASGLDEAGGRSLDRAEAISDRLLETRLPFAWISGESYSLEARLRQIQSRTDRAQALRAGGARRDDVLGAIVDLQGAVAGLRTVLAAGGSTSPPPIDELLTRLDTARR